MSTLTLELRTRIENTIRCLTVDAVEAAGCGHPGAPMGLARPVLELWHSHLRFDPQDPQWPLRDRFVLSAGHASMLLYSLLHLFGYELSLDEIRQFRQLHSKTPGHPEFGETVGVEVTTGPLGQGFAHGVGMALGGQLTRARFGRDGNGPGYHYIYGVVSDGDLMEGVSYEAASLAGHLKLGNLIYLYDSNQVTIDGTTELSFSENVPQRFEAQGWHVQQVEGEDFQALHDALKQARENTNQPSLIVVTTMIGKGSPKYEGKPDAHGKAFGTEEANKTKERLGWPADQDFYIPEDVKSYLAETIDRKITERKTLDQKLESWKSSHPALDLAWKEARNPPPIENLRAILTEGMEGKADATRKHGAAVMAKVAEQYPFMVGGSADLAGSAAPALLKNTSAVGIAAEGDGERFGGRNLFFGVREHAMGAITNGINLDGTFLGYCGTFLTFSDYMRPSVRLAALMKVRTVFVFTHDSIFLGEDGPTHQPIEHVDALRSIPGLTVFRPADGVETALAWEWVLTQAQGPVAFILTRQKVAAFQRSENFDNSLIHKGAYIVQDPSEGNSDLILLGSGSEVPLLTDSAALLEQQGYKVRVVSIPSLELFLNQPEAYRNEVIPPNHPLVVGVEAGRAESLRIVMGANSLIYGINRFGASAPWKMLAEEFGYTPSKLTEWVLSHLKKA